MIKNLRKFTVNKMKSSVIRVISNRFTVKMEKSRLTRLFTKDSLAKFTDLNRLISLILFFFRF